MFENGAMYNILAADYTPNENYVLMLISWPCCGGKVTGWLGVFWYFEQP